MTTHEFQSLRRYCTVGTIHGAVIRFEILSNCFSSKHIMDANAENLSRTLEFREFAKHVMPVDFVNRTGYGGVPGYTKPPDLKLRRRARDLSQTNMRKAAGHKTFEQLEEILRSKIMKRTQRWCVKAFVDYY